MLLLQLGAGQRSSAGAGGVVNVCARGAHRRCAIECRDRGAIAVVHACGNPARKRASPVGPHPSSDAGWRGRFSCVLAMLASLSRAYVSSIAYGQ
eukprot:3224884-Prymnesium_polylepis.1